MKFLCDRCKTRYSIGDDRVRGKILKIRCKNCANVITVREGMSDADAAPEATGGLPRRSGKPTTLAPAAQPPAQPQSAKPPPALEEEWYVSIDGEQSGPFSLFEAQRWIGSKAATADLHCWSEGFDDWLPVDKVSHFRGLRKKSAPIAPLSPPSPPPRATVAVAAIQVEEEEPRPLFAATMAAIEKSVAANQARATPMGGSPAMPYGPGPSMGSANGSTTPAPKLTNGSSQHAALTPQPIVARNQTGGIPALPRNQTGGVPALPRNQTGPAAALPRPQTGGMPAIAKNQSGPVPAMPSPFGQTGKTGPKPALPAFDSSEGADVPTEIEVPPFGEEKSTAAEPVAAKARNPGLPAPFAAAPPVRSPAMFNPEPLPQPMLPAPIFPAARLPEPEPEGDIEIGEVSRVVNLADLARTAPRKNPQPRMRTNPGIGNSDPIAAMVATPDLSFAAQSAMVPEQAAARSSNKKLYVLLGGVVLVLLIVVGAVVYSVTRNDDDDTTTFAHGREIDLARPDDPQHRADPVDKPDVKEPVVPTHVPTPHRPNVPVVPTGSGKTPIVEPDTTDGTPLKAEEVEAMARTQSDATNRCYMRAQRGAEAILVGDVKRINVTLTIDKEGVVNTVDLSDHATDTLGKCLQQRIKGWRFHPSTRGLTTRLTLVFQAT